MLLKMKILEKHIRFKDLLLLLLLVLERPCDVATVMQLLQLITKVAMKAGRLSAAAVTTD
jgi:hypothetical protein